MSGYSNDNIYAQLNVDGFCTGISFLSGNIMSDCVVSIESYDTAFLNRKYDLTNKKWLDEYLKVEEVEKEATNSEILAKLKEQEISSLDREEMLLEQQILLLNIDLNTSL